MSQVDANEIHRPHHTADESFTVNDPHALSCCHLSATLFMTPPQHWRDAMPGIPQCGATIAAWQSVARSRRAKNALATLAITSVRLSSMSNASPKAGVIGTSKARNGSLTSYSKTIRRVTAPSTASKSWQPGAISPSIWCAHVNAREASRPAENDPDGTR